MAARTIDPATGASTWALGSQRCTVNIGSLTKNAIKTTITRKFHVQKRLSSKNEVRSLEFIIMFEDEASLALQIIIRRRGSDAATV